MSANSVVSQFLTDNELLEHDLLQGTQEWEAFRLEHDGSSEAAAMLGLSKNVKRTELLRAKHTGIAKEFSDWVRENVLERGHDVEALARPIVERMLGCKLYPVVCSRGRMSTSLDGRTAAGNTLWECKQWNEAIAESTSKGILPDEHKPQCYQHLLVTGADRLIFTVSDGTEENTISIEVMPDVEWFARIILGWVQFHKDRAAYIPSEIAEMPKAEVTIDLPALFVHAKGEITTHNMDEFGKALTEKLSEMRAIVLSTDQDFSNAKEAAKKFRETAKAIALSKEQMLAQTETIGEAARKMDAWAKDLNATALQLEKDVEREDKAKKEVMVLGGQNAYAEHIAALEEEIKPIRLNLRAPNFAEAIKGKRNYASMQDAVDTMLAGAKVTADAADKDVRAKLAWCKENAAGHSALFPDLQQIITKPIEDFTLTITSRIEAAKKAEAEKMEAERKRMEAEATAKAEREAADKIAQEEARIRAEERAKAGEEANALAKEKVRAAEEAGMEQESIAPIAKPDNVVVIEHQDAISAFLSSRNFSDAGKVRAILVEFVKFSEQFKSKKVAERN
ncbi:MAG: YqaJ viral recombinase family protein [Candidatus Ferrigenium altingense]